MCGRRSSTRRQLLIHSKPLTSHKHSQAQFINAVMAEMDIDAALEEACNHPQSQRRRTADSLLACFDYLESTF
jgi:hypothetical protein